MQSDEPIIPVEAPGVILKRPEIEPVEDVGPSLVGKDRVIQFGVTVLLAEEKAEGVLGVARAPAVSAPNANATVNMKALGPIGINQFDRGRAFPRDTVIAGVGIDAERRIKKILEVRRDAVARNDFEVVLNLPAIRRIIDDVGVHAVIDDILAPTGRPPCRRSEERR